MQDESLGTQIQQDSTTYSTFLAHIYDPLDSILSHTASHLTELAVIEFCFRTTRFYKL